MRKGLIAAFAFMLILNIGKTALAEEAAGKDLSDTTETAERGEAKADPVTKFGRGLCNLTTFYFEINEQSRRVKARNGSCVGMTYGLAKGIYMSGVRALVGVYEVCTFFLPYPDGYKPILTDPVSFFPAPPKKIAVTAQPANTGGGNGQGMVAKGY